MLFTQELYKTSLGEPNGHRAHELLHTHYHDRSGASMPAYSTTDKLHSHVPAEITAALHAESERDPGPGPVAK